MCAFASWIFSVLFFSCFCTVDWNLLEFVQFQLSFFVVPHASRVSSIRIVQCVTDNYKHDRYLMAFRLIFKIFRRGEYFIVNLMQLLKD